MHEPSGSWHVFGPPGTGEAARLFHARGSPPCSHSELDSRPLHPVHSSDPTCVGGGRSGNGYIERGSPSMASQPSKALQNGSTGRSHCVPLELGGAKLIWCSPGHVEVVVVVPDEIAEFLSITDGTRVYVDNRKARFNLRLTEAEWIALSADRPSLSTCIPPK